MAATQTITMQAEGDPSTFSMTMNVLRPSDGKMVKLTTYPDLDVNAGGTLYTTPGVGG